MGTSTNRYPDQTIDNLDVNPNMDNDSWNIKRRYVSLNKIWTNPSWYPNPRVQKFDPNTGHPFSDGTQGVTVRAPNNGDNILATDFENARIILGQGATAINSLTGSSVAQPSGYASPGQIISASHIQNMIQTILALESRLDSYNSYYDASDLCARSCQVACQTACQSSCQGCNTSQCHNQKCGLH